MEFLTQHRVSERYSHMRVDQFLARRYGYLSRSEWQNEISRGKVLFNGAVLTKYDKKIKTGDLIAYKGRDAVEPEVDSDYSIIYEDDYLIGVNKPGNLPVHPAGVFYHNTLLTFLEDRYGIKLHLLHRLDRETSGVIILAKDSRVASEIHKNFNCVQKKYLALVHGVPEADEFTIDVPIDFDTASAAEHKRVARPDAREKASTAFARIMSFNGLSLLKAVPFTGRQHQIRVHLKHAGFPIVGDKLYGRDERVYLDMVKKGPTDDAVRKLGFRRSALHSRSIRFNHPAIHKEICIKAPLPDDMKQFINHGRNADV
jgi:RluA family pseudouridine synthase